MSQTLNWVDNVIVDRLSQRANVFIRQTEDKTRIDQLVDAIAACNLTTSFKQTCGFAHMLDFNILRHELRDIRPGGQRPLVAPEIREGKSQLQQIDDRLHVLAPPKSDQPQGALVVMHWVLTKAHADSISDWLAAWSQDKTLYKNTGTVFVFTTDETLFGEALRRLCSTASIPPGSDAEIRDVLDTLSARMKQLHLQVTDPLVQAARGLNLHQTETAALKGIFTTPNRQFALQPFTDLKVQILESTGLSYIQQTLDPSSIGGYAPLKREFNDFVVALLKDPSKALYYGLQPPRGIVMDGPPGVGKTLFALTISKLLGLAMIKLTPADLYRSLVGESEGRIKRLTELIESLSPVVVFIDEMDNLLRARSEVMATDSGVNRRIVNGLLDWLGMPNRRSFVIGATNRIEDIDEAAVRPGRFDEIIYVPYPDKQGREEIFKVQCTVLNKIPIDPTLSYAELAVQSPFLSGAEIAKWCSLAARAAMHKGDKTVTQDHFKEVAAQIVIDPKKRWQNMQDKIKLLKSGGVFSNVNVPLLDESLKELELEAESGASETGSDRLSAFSKNMEKQGRPV